MPHLFDIDDLSPADFARVLQLAGPDQLERVLAGHGVALLFEKPSARTRNSMEMAIGLLASGLDPERCTLFVQSHVAEHAQLSWLLE